MQLIYNETKTRFEFVCAKNERQVPKDAGFRFDWDTNTWHTNDPDHALRVAHYADTSVQQRIQHVKEADVPSLRWDGDLYVWKSSIKYKDYPKQAGFKWNPTVLTWETTDWDKAIKLISFMDAATKEHVNKALAHYNASLELSRSASSAIALKVPQGLDYLPYQKAGIQYGLDRDAVLISDEMGLGKTIQAIGILNNSKNLKKVLILCPASLRLNWKRECEKWLVHPMSIGIVTTKQKELPATDVVICNYDILHKFKDQVDAVQWDALIADEAHYLKNPDSRRSKTVVGQVDYKTGVVKVKPIQALKRILLTGTPIPNRVKEVWPLISYLDPMTWNNFFQFGKRYCAGTQTRYGWDFDGASYTSELQDKLRGTFMIRRLKSDVLKELPAKIRQVIPLELTGVESLIKKEQEAYRQYEDIKAALQAQAQLARLVSEDAYDAAIRELNYQAKVKFADISRMRHELAVKKAPAVIEFVQDALDDPTHKIVLFAHHADVIDQFKAAFGDKAVSLTGSTPMAQRQEAVDRFQNDPSVQLFIGNIIAAGVGITLTTAAHVIFAELDWVPGNVQQAEDRCHRIGQKDTVLIQHLVYDGSLDAKMAQTLIEKQIAMDAVLDNKTDYSADVEEIKMDFGQEVSPVFLDQTLAQKRGTRQITVVPTKDTSSYADRKISGFTSVKVSELDSAATALTPQDIARIHAGLKTLSAMCDGAQSMDGMGFNKTDSYMGKALAAQAGLTPREAALGLQLVTKYKRQLQ